MELLDKIESDARARSIPVILRPTRVYLEKLIKEHQPKSILEIGMAVGYSASVMLSVSEAHITCLEASRPNIVEAKANFAALGLEDRVTIIEGDCMKTLPKLNKKYDFIFLDGPKGKYLDMIPLILPLLSKKGIWLSDNVLFRGMVNGQSEISEHRFIHTVGVLREFLEKLESDTSLDTTILDIGDGLCQVQSKEGKNE